MILESLHGVSISEMYLLYTAAAVKLVRLADAQWHLNLAIMMTNGIPEISRLFLEPFFCHLHVSILHYLAGTNHHYQET